MQNESPRSLIYQLGDGSWTVKNRLKIFTNPIVACCWFNRERRYQGAESLDGRESQLMQWEAIGVGY